MNTYIKVALEGDPYAAQELVRSHYQQVFSFVYRMVGDWHLASDLTQDVFIKALSVLSTYSFRGKFSSWLFTIASNKVKDYWRYQSRRPTESIEGVSLPSDFDVEEEALEEERSREIKAALETLSPIQREVVILRYYHDMKVADIALITDTNLSTVKSRLRLGLMALKQALVRGDYIAKG